MPLPKWISLQIAFSLFTLLGSNVAFGEESAAASKTSGWGVGASATLDKSGNSETSLTIQDFAKKLETTPSTTIQTELSYGVDLGRAKVDKSDSTQGVLAPSLVYKKSKAYELVSLGPCSGQIGIGAGLSGQLNLLKPDQQTAGSHLIGGPETQLSVRCQPTPGFTAILGPVASGALGWSSYGMAANLSAGGRLELNVKDRLSAKSEISTTVVGIEDGGKKTQAGLQLSLVLGKSLYVGLDGKASFVSDRSEKIVSAIELGSAAKIFQGQAVVGGAF